MQESALALDCCMLPQHNEHYWSYEDKEPCEVALLYATTP